MNTPRYRAWLLRCRASRDSADSSWHYHLEDPHTGARHAFANLAELVAHLQAESVAGEPAPQPVGERSAGQGGTTRPVLPATLGDIEGLVGPA